MHFVRHKLEQGVAKEGFSGREIIICLLALADLVQFRERQYQVLSLRLVTIASIPITTCSACGLHFIIESSDAVLFLLPQYDQKSAVPFSPAQISMKMKIETKMQKEKELSENTEQFQDTWVRHFTSLHFTSLSLCSLGLPFHACKTTHTHPPTHTKRTAPKFS
jgi:hypothetical protein